jgi:hypothetical protein
VIVYADPQYVVDWNWSDELTVWAIDGDRADRRVASHRFSSRPRTERQAVEATRRWWEETGRAEAARTEQAAEKGKEAS